MSPASAGGAHVKTARPVEDHLVRVSPVHDVLEKGIDHKEQVGQEESANPLGRLPGKEIARGIKKEFLSRGMARMAALGFDYLSDQQAVPGGRQGIVEQVLKFGIVLDGLELGILEANSLLNDPDDLLLFHDTSFKYQYQCLPIGLSDNPSHSRKKIKGEGSVPYRCLSPISAGDV